MQYLSHFKKQCNQSAKIALNSFGYPDDLLRKAFPEQINMFGNNVPALLARYVKMFVRMEWDIRHKQYPNHYKNKLNILEVKSAIRGHLDFYRLRMR